MQQPSFHTIYLKQLVLKDVKFNHLARYIAPDKTPVFPLKQIYQT